MFGVFVKIMHQCYASHTKTKAYLSASACVCFFTGKTCIKSCICDDENARIHFSAPRRESI